MLLMIEKDTVKLLKECDAGVKMGIDSIDDVLPHVKSNELEGYLVKCKKAHEELEDEIEGQLARFGDAGKDPGMMAKGMAHMKTNMKLMVNASDRTVADLMTDGCNMGVKSLARYLNEYKAADEFSKDITKRLISLEEQLAGDIRPFL
jgi:hypothetical protein